MKSVGLPANRKICEVKGANQRHRNELRVQFLPKRSLRLGCGSAELTTKTKVISSLCFDIARRS